MLEKLYRISVEVDKLHNAYDSCKVPETKQLIKQKLEAKRQELYAELGQEKSA